MLDFVNFDITVIGSVLFRVLLSAFLGGAIAIDRVKKRRPAGIKTHALVCMGAALVMLTGEYLSYTYDSSTDVARLAAQVISGVGFLGAGTIMVTGRNQIKGLTTAATLWFSATLGLAIGSGFYIGVFSSLIALFMITKVFSIYDSHLQRNSYVLDLYVELNGDVPIGTILKSIRTMGCHTNEVDKIESFSSTNKLYFMSVGLPTTLSHQTIIETLTSIQGVNFIDEV